MRTTWAFHCPPGIVFGRGAIAQTGEELRRLGARRAVVITDRVLAAAGIVERVCEAMRSAGIESAVFDGGECEPSLGAAERAISFARPHAPQAIVGLGGGSNMDLAKITAVVLAHGGGPGDYFGFDRVPGPILPLVCLPTTAGTGSEVSHSSVLTDPSAKMKVSTLSEYLRPRAAVVDPDLTLSCPAKVTAESGIDALTHAIEAMTAIDATAYHLPPGEKYAYQGRYLLGESLAEQAIRLVGKHLVTAYREPQNMAAREGMSLAATLAGLAFSNCAVALVHALEYPLGGALHCSHGAGNGLLLPYVMRFNLPERKESFARIAEWLGEPTPGKTLDEAAAMAILAVERLRREIGIPQRIRDLGGREEQLAEFAARSFAIKRLISVNPRRASEVDLLDILRAAY